MNAFDRWWREWAARNERLYDEAQRARELAVARRWAQAHIDFHFGGNNNSTKENDDHEQDND